MDGGTTEEKAEIFVCLKILLENLVKHEDIRQLANVLKKNDVISKGFPADQDAKILISHLVQVQDKSLIFIIKNWENISQCEAGLKHLVSGDGVGDEDWVKALVFVAFDEILQQKEEKPIFDFIRNAISKLEASKEQPAESYLDRPGKTMPVKLKRTEPPGSRQPGSSHHSSEKEKNALSDVKTSPPPAKKSKISKQEKSDLKRQQDDVTKSQSKKHKSEDSDQSVPSSCNETPVEEVTCSEHVRDEVKNISATGEEQDHHGGDKTNKSRGKKDSRKGKSTAGSRKDGKQNAGGDAKTESKDDEAKSGGQDIQMMRGNRKTSPDNSSQKAKKIPENSAKVKAPGRRAKNENKSPQHESAEKSDDSDISSSSSSDESQPDKESDGKGKNDSGKKGKSTARSGKNGKQYTGGDAKTESKDDGAKGQSVQGTRGNHKTLLDKSKQKAKKNSKTSDTSTTQESSNEDGNKSSQNETSKKSDDSDGSSSLTSSSDDESPSEKESDDKGGWSTVTSTKRTTRSQTAARKKTKDHKDDSNQPSITLLNPEAPINLAEQDERVLEIRAIVSQSKSLPQYATLCMACYQSKWEPVEMGYNDRKGYFFLRVLHNSAGNFEFKFCYVNQHTRDTEWENLPCYNPRANRKLDLNKVMTSWMFAFNVCIFKRASSWADKCCEDMGRFLPEFKVGATGESDAHISPAVELFSWVNCVTKGWSMDSWSYERLKPKDYVFEEILLKWLENWTNSESHDTDGKFRKIHVALVLAVSFASEKHRIVRPKLLVALFQMLTLHGLDRETCKKVYVAVKKEFEVAAEFGIDLPSYREAMEWLYRRIPDKPNLDWLFSLPLYWLLVHGEVEDEVLKPSAQRGFLYARSSLPSISDFDWTFVSRKCHSSDVRIFEDLVTKVLETANLHPWITGTFQFLLTYTEVGKLILSRKESKIAMRFQLDATFVQYICGYAKGHYSRFKTEEHQSCDDYFCERLSEAITHAAEPEIPHPERLQQLAMCTNIIEYVNEFLKLNLKVLDNADISWSIGTITQKTAYWARLLDLGEEELKEFRDHLTKMLELVKKRIHMRTTVSVKEVEHWNRLMKIEWDFDWLAHKWKEQIIYEIKNAVMNCCLNTRTREMDGDKYLSFYVDDLSNIDLVPEIEKCFDEIAYTCMEGILKTTETGPGMFGKVTNWVKSKLGGGPSSSKLRFISIFEKLFKKSYEKARASRGSEMTIALNFLCKWSFSAHFYELFGQEMPDSFSKETKSAVKKIADNFTKVVNSLRGAKTTVEHLKTILENKERFLLVSAVLVLDEKEGARTSAKDAIDLCKSYLRTFKRTKAAVEDFIYICFFKDYDDGELLPHEELVSKSKENVQKTKICDLVVITDDGQPSSNDFFGITDEQLAEFRQISFIKDSKKIFPEMYTSAVDGIAIDDGIDKPWTELLQVFIDVKHQIFNLIDEIDSGTIMMDSVIQRFKILDGKKKEIDCEVDLFYDFYKKFHQPDAENDENDNVDVGILENHDVRKKQIFNTFQLQSANNAVDTLLELRDLLVLGGNFTALTNRKEMIENQDSIQLHTVPEALEIPEICSVDAKKLSSLKKFMNAKQVIEWLRTKMKGMNEVKVMCDLAMISAGENAIEVDRVSNLLSAVMGFAPLIFWADNERENAGSKQLLKKCVKIWKNAKATKDLIPKWEETSRQLKWFQEVEKFYGSVEKSSLTRAQEINERGVYRISRHRANENLTVENCIHLEIPGKTRADSAITLNLEELRELQSKLMLIAGEAEKGRQDVNVFVDVLTSVQKLAEVYVQLIASGCMLFTGWKTAITCHDGGTLSIQISFIDDAPPIIGSGTHSELDKLTEILKKSLVTWDEHISSKRMEYYHLNEYNIQQIMYLCRELANLEDLEQIPEQVRALLTFVRKDFSIEDLQEYLQETRRNMKQSYHDMDIDNKAVADAVQDFMDEDDMEPANEGNNTGAESQDDTKKKRQLVRTLTSQEDVTEEEAKAAVQAIGTHDLSSCIEWILLNGLDEELVEKYSTEYDDNVDFVQPHHEMEVVHSVFNPNSENTLKEVIGRLQEEIQIVDDADFLNCVNTVCAGYLDETIAMNLQDHLSIGLLGTFLDNLNEEGQIHRDLRPGLRHGRPNLLICGEEEVLPTVLSLYMHNMDQPLPSRSEVLVCGAETQGEEVERFLRRAMSKSGNGGRLLYTLAFADKLNYSTSSKVEDIFNKLSKSGKVGEKYQLVILLCKQQHYLTTCFDKYVVDGKWSQTTDKIQSYLKQHLEVVETETSAASVTKGNFMVKVVTSTRSGVGKSLYVQRLNEELRQRTDIDSRNVTIRLLENKLDLDYVIEKLNQNGNRAHADNAVLVHVDLTPAVQHGIEAFAFNLFMLGSIQGSDGKVWKTHQNHLYVVEMTDFGTTGEKRFSSRHILNLLPCVKCYAPREVLNATLTTSGEILGMDEAEFHSETFQRPFQYLRRYQNNEDLDEFTYLEAQGNIRECIEVLLRHCCIGNPSWAQLRHFCSFLNVQLKNCEKSVFCTNPHIKPELAGLKVFAVKFMIKMAQDFATPSLEISDRSVKDSSIPQGNNQRGFEAHQIRRKWEETSHPYVFFNEDGQTMTFINLKINKNGFLIAQNGVAGTERIATPELVAALQRQGFNLAKNFDDYSRVEKLRFLCQVLGRKEVFDPDPTYELTTDNVLKILAIYMRFRCQIPVIIMGETGCGKTRLVEFMSKLKSRKTATEANLPRAGQNVASKQEVVKNMITLKIHGGISVKNIHKSVEEAKLTEMQNRANDDHFTVLFYDEANTTEAIYAIKEVMCDKSIDGRFFGDSKLQIVAACNPYKKLSKAAIKKLEDSGLGYRIRTSETAHLFGNIPVRSLVYRVVALPPSMQPFVWDFGQLSDDAEKIYIQQMTRKLAEKLGLTQKATAMINNVLSSCQQYMRTRTDECRYVSLRDVERCMTTYEWFYTRREVIYPAVEKEVKKRCEKARTQPPAIDIEVRTLIQTIGVCYHASLDKREEFRTQLAGFLNVTDIDEFYIKTELAACQEAFLRNVQIGENIARNEALRENVFMMAVCADMRIPLFLIGKPGSSKSLAKTIVTNNMQGQASHSQLYRRLKQIHVLSYQCSALTDAEGIERIFTQCSQLQKRQNSDAYTAVVVLDEIGLAEDSPNMPLKVLHPLLERRRTDLNTVAHPDTERVGFVGISNWALDPAKMNRGIFLTRTKPSPDDLKKTGKEIFQGKKSLWKSNEDLFKTLTSTYLTMYKEQEVEYFGLRDYYSLMKMVCSRCDKSVKFSEVVYAILRNFSGGEYQVAEGFLESTKKVLEIEEPIPTIPIQEMIMHNLMETDSRFLLLLANQFSVVSLLESCVEISSQGAQVVFGSSFPGDHSYTEICRNINRIKVCMETGRTVILLNMAKIHESLYDALNQHYVTFGGQNYVDLGLGGHRVKCRIANDFRLIVIEKKDTVYQQYPIPLINRLEKHHFNSDGLLDEEQSYQSKKLTDWASNFVANTSSFTSGHAFVGFHDDTISSVVLTTEGDFEDHKSVLLQSCSMDAILRLPGSNLRDREVGNLQQLYFEKQHHDGLADVLKTEIEAENPFSVLEITSFSGVLSKKDVERLHSDLELQKGTIILLSLEQFHTQQEYSDRLDKFFGRCTRQDFVGAPMVLLVQCAKAQSQASLIACARHCLMNKIREVKHRISETRVGINITVALLLSTEREGISRSKMDALALQPTPETQIIHVDEMRPTDDHIAPASNFIGKTLREVFEAGKKELDAEKEELDAGKEELDAGKRLESLVNIRSLLVDCVCESVTKVEGQTKENERYLKRVEILMKLCSSNDDAGYHFRKILLKKVVEIVSEMEKEDQGITNWITDKANNRESLQEGGTFRKTLWLCLKGHMSRFMAYIISIIDRRGNMDLIAKIPAVPWVLNMWLGMFDQLETSWQNVKGGAKFMIYGSRKQSSCKLPFSFLIIDYLQIQWNALELQPSENFEESFFRLFHDFGMKKIIPDALDSAKIDVMRNFISDLVGSIYRCGTEDKTEIEIVEKIIFDIAMKNLETTRNENYFLKGDEIAVIFLTYKALSDQLEKFSESLQGCPQVLRNSTKWKEEQKNSREFTLHILAFKDVLNLLKNMAERIQDSKPCLDWIDLARTAKKIFDSVSGVLHDAVVLETLKKDWVPLLLLDLLLLQLLPPAHSDNAKFRNFVKVIAPHAKLFWRGSVSTDARSYNFLRIVLNVLKRCYADINLHLLVNWRDTNCRICRNKIQNPSFLPCGHFGCEKCIAQHVRTSERCMTCTAQIPVDFIPHPAELDEKQIRISEKLMSNCTSFFLEYLQQFCFKNITGASGRMEQHVQQILKELIIQSDNEDDRKELDSTGLDLNVNTKSCMLQILLQHNRSLVVEKVNQALKETEENARNLLITVILKNSEQKILAKSSKFVENKEKCTKFWQEVLRSSWQGLLRVEETKILEFEDLQQVAALRCALMYFTSIVEEKRRSVEFREDEKIQIDGFLHLCLDLLTSDNMPQAVRDFVIKTGCRKFGTQWFYQMAEHKDLRALIPPSLRQAAEGCNVDHLALLGREYIDTKSDLYQTDENDQQREVAAIFEQQATNRLPYLLAVSSWCDNKDQVVKQAVADILKQTYVGGNFLVEFLLKGKDDLTSLLENNLATTQEVNILYQLLVMVVAATTSQNDIMKGFYGIVNNAQSARELFLPAMPEDVFFATPADYRVENMDKASMYMCPKGHLYSIGDCTRPAVETKCPTCKSTIGGTSHRPATGNRKVTKTTQSQAGYKNVTAGETVSTGADRMSPQGAAVVDFILHSCFLAALVNKQGAVASILQCSDVQARQFLVQQLQLNLRNLSTSLARNVDDTVLILHRILLRIISQGPTTHPENWATLDARKTWEQTFRTKYLLPVFQNLETEITNARAVMREAEEAGSAPLNRLIHEVPDDDDETVTDYSWEERSLWKIIDHPNSAHLIQVLGDKMEESGGEVLQIILHTPDLHFVKFLENVLRLQQKLTEKYQYKIDMNDADQMTFRKHIIEDGGHSDETAIMEYISAWNMVYESLQNVAPDYLSKYFEPISLDSPMSMVLPSIRGRGQCAKILAEYLIEIQNQFLTKCVEVIKPAQKLKEVEVHHLVSTDFVCINKQKDLLNLINMHTSYTITSDDQGRHHAISYNIEALEKQVREKFVMCKKSIKKNTIPCMKYPQDVGIGSDWQKVAASISQDSLTAKLSQDINRIVEKSLSSEVCEGVRTLTNAISFLAMVKADPSKTLCEFLEKDLKLPSARTSIIPRSAQISHVLSLYQRLTWHKAIIFVQQGLDPYKEALSGIVQDLISGEVLVATLEAFEHIDVIVLQQRINEMLITGTGIDNADWTLNEDVFPYLWFIEGNSDDDSWYSRLPNELCCKHLGDLFRLTVECKANTRDMANQRFDATRLSALRMAKTAEGTPVTRLSSLKTMMFQLSEELDRRIKTKSTRSKIIGPEGGFVEIFGCRITFRKGTFKKDTKVEISVITDFTACHEDRMPVAPTIECFPAGILNPPALLEVEHWASPIKGDKTQYAEVFRNGGEEANSEFVAKLPIEENRPLSLNIDHFTLFDFVMWMVAGQATLQNRVYISNAHQSIACVCCLKDEKIMTNVQQAMRESNYVPLLPLWETVHLKSGNDVTITITCLQPQGFQMSDQENGIDGVEMATVFSVNTIVRNSKEIRYLPISLENGNLANFNGLLGFGYAHDAAEGQNVRHPMQTLWPFRDAAPTHVANVRNVLNTYGPIRTNAIVGPDARGQGN